MSKKRFDTTNLQQIIGRSLKTEEEAQIALWEKGRALASITPQFGWDVILEMLQSYPLKAMNDLMTLDPVETSTEQKLAMHAIAYAANRIYISFQEDVAAAIEASRKPPDVITEQLRHLTTAPPEI